MRVLVTGGRDYHNWKHVFDELEALNPSLVIHGGSTGADNSAKRWADLNNVPVLAYPARWIRNGVVDRSAGPRRNIWMLQDSRPDLVLAFPGGAGTAHMVKIALVAGVKVKRVQL